MADHSQKQCAVASLRPCVAPCSCHPWQGIPCSRGPAETLPSALERGHTQRSLWIRNKTKLRSVHVHSRANVRICIWYLLATNIHFSIQAFGIGTSDESDLSIQLMLQAKSNDSNQNRQHQTCTSRNCRARASPPCIQQFNLDSHSEAIAQALGKSIPEFNEFLSVALSAHLTRAAIPARPRQASSFRNRASMRHYCCCSHSFWRPGAYGFRWLRRELRLSRTSSKIQLAHCSTHASTQ